MASSSLPLRTRRPSYLGVLWTVLRNNLVRDMSFRGNFILDCVSSLAWVLMNLGLYHLIFRYTAEIGHGTGWGKYEFYVFLATTIIINSVVQAFFMPSAEQFSELIRTGQLDFALLKPIDTQFLISLHRVEWSSLSNAIFGVGLLLFSTRHLSEQAAPAWHVTPGLVLLYAFHLVCGIVMLYCLMISLAATSIWLGRNQTLYDFWFYITNFSRYPWDIYRGRLGSPLRWFFMYIIPVLLVINVPARVLALPLRFSWHYSLASLTATVVSVVASRWVFQRALHSYRSASS